MPIPDFSGIAVQENLNYFNDELKNYEENSHNTNTLKIFYTSDSGNLVSSAFDFADLTYTYAKERNLFCTISGGTQYGVDFITDLEYRNRLTDAFTKPIITVPVARIGATAVTVYPSDYATAAYVFEYIKYPTTPNLDYYIDVNGRYQVLAAGATHTWTTSETDSAGTVHTTGDTDWTSLTVEFEWPDKDKMEIFARMMTVIGVRMEANDIAQYFNAETIKLNTDD